MSIRRLFFFLLVAVAFLIATGILIKSNPDPDGELFAGRNVNMVSIDDNVQRQNEPSLAVSTLDPRHLLAGANDYSLVDFNGDDVDVTYDAWLGVFKSFDGGESWDHDLLPPYQGALLSPGPPQPDESHPLFGFDAAADPTVRAGLDGWFYYSGIAFDREKNGDSVIFVVRYRDTGSDIVYHDTKIIDTGTSGQFSDKPWIAVDIPRSPPEGIVYIVYSIFLGQIDPEKNIHSKILVSKSTNGGDTWKKPVKVSESEQKNNGTIMAIDPNDGTLYVAWRRFRSVNVPHGILITKSENFGKHFKKTVEVATPIRPFDQGTIKGGPVMPAQFRTFAFPAMAVDHSGTIHVAWSQRDVDQEFADDARIVIASQAKDDWGLGWAYIPVESPVEIYDPGNPAYITIHSHQFMPSLTYGAGKLMIAWYDNRYSARVFDEWGSMRLPYPHCPFGESTTDPADRIIDGADSCEYRETIDVRAAQATPIPGFSPDIGESIQVSRYIWFLQETGDPDMPYIPIQGQFNPPNYKLFSAGTAPFHGDYLDIVSAPQFIQDSNPGWRFSQEGDPLVYYVSWTDNRDVLPPDNDLWAFYTPPAPGTCTAGMRNQNIYVSKITPGIEVGVLGEFINDDGLRVFVIYIDNETGSPFEVPPEPQYKRFELNINVSPGEASFFPGVPPSGSENGRTIVVDVPDHSSISRMVFVSVTDPIDVQITEIDTGTFTDSVALEPGIPLHMTGESSITKYELDYINWIDPPYNPTDEVGAPLLPNPNILAPNILAPNILAPNILAPNILSPNILAPNILAPNILAPNILAPNILAPNILAPNILAMSILNPNILSPNILATPPGPDTEIVDKIWTVTNNTNAVSSYTFKSIAGDSLPADLVYLHLLIFKVHITPSTDGCALKDQVQHELLVNITPPEVIYTVDPEEIEEIIGDPNAEFENATFSLGPNEEGLVILRVIDTHQPGGGPSSSIMTAQGESIEPPTEAESFAGNLGGLAVSHASTEGSPVSAITLMILPATLPEGQLGSLYSATLNAIGGTEPYTWTSDPANPAGLEIDPSSGEISGYPSEVGIFTFTVIVTDGVETDTQGFSIEIVGPPPLTLTMDPEPPPDAIQNSPYPVGESEFLRFTATGGIPLSGEEQLYSWTLYDAPVGLSLDLVSSGEAGEVMELTGTPTEADNFYVTVEVMDDSDTSVTKSFYLCVKPEPLEMIPSYDVTPITCDASDPPICQLPDGVLGADYAAHNVTLATINHNPGPEAYLTWEIIDGNLPPGLAFEPSLNGDPVYQIISFPTRVDSDYPIPYFFTVQVTEFYDFGGGCAGERSTEKRMSIRVAEPLVITTTTLDDGLVGSDYSATLAATGGIPDYTWSIASGLPPGLSLNPSTGTISGTPTTAGTFSFTARVSDAGWPGQATEKLLSIRVIEPLVITTTSLPSGEEDERYSATLGATGGIEPYTWSIVWGRLPPGLTLNPSTGEISGETDDDDGTFRFTVQVTESSSLQLIDTKRLTIRIED